MANANNDRLSTVEQTGFSTGWDWKGQYIGQLQEDGYERFSQFSATPDTTALFAGPARYTGLSDNTSVLTPIGLADNISIQMDASLARLYEVGSNRAFFTRGKTQIGMSMQKFLADQANILRALSKSSYRPELIDTGFSAPGPETPNPEIQMNLDSEVFAVPFGLLMVFKTRGGGTDGYGKVLTGLYAEYCMFQNYSFQVVNANPVIAEGVSIQLDRFVPVSFA